MKSFEEWVRLRETTATATPKAPTEPGTKTPTRPGEAPSRPLRPGKLPLTPGVNPKEKPQAGKKNDQPSA